MWVLLLKFLRVLKFQWIHKILATAFSVVALWVFRALVAFCPQAAMYIQKRIVATYYTPPEEWAGFISEYMERLTGAKISLEDIIKEGAGLGSRTSMKAVGEKFMEPMLGLIMPTKEEQKTEPLAGAERFLGTNLQFQLSAWLLHLLGDMQSFGVFKSLKDLPNAISWSYGIGWLSWMVMGPVFRAGITAPMEKYFAAIYTPEMLTIAQIIDAKRHDLLTDTEFFDSLKERGISVEKARILYELAQKDYSDADIRNLLNLGWMEETDAVEEMKRRGYDPNRSTILARLLRDDRRLSIIDDIVKEAGEQYKDGLLEDGPYRGYLEMVGYKVDEQDLQISLLKLQKTRRRYLTPAQVTQAYKQKIIGRYQARDYLRDLGMTDEDVEVYLKLKVGGGE